MAQLLVGAGVIVGVAGVVWLLVLAEKWLEPGSEAAAADSDQAGAGTDLRSKEME